MEKIKYPPLVAHLQAEHPLYNQLYAAHELRYGPIDSHLLHHWLATVIEPLVMEATAQDNDKLPAVFKAFYTELLRLAGAGLLVSHEAEYKALWKLCATLPFLAKHPAKTMAALHSALLSVLSFQPQKAALWLELLHKTAPACTSFNDLLHCGRFTAWFCGLAHLREKCSASFSTLPAPLQQALQAHCPAAQPLTELLTGAWFTTNSPAFMGAPGGFTGFGGAFAKPPLIDHKNGYVLAADGEHSFLLFADSFGQVLLPNGEGSFTAKANLHPAKAFAKKFGAGAIPYADISSCVLLNNAAFFTRSSSHHIYIYGFANGD